MAVTAPFAASLYRLPSCELQALHEAQVARVLGELLAAMEPWSTLGYTAVGLQRYLLRPETTLYRHVIVVQGEMAGVVCTRYPWLRGVCLELLGLAATFQNGGRGRDIMQWIEEQTSPQSPNVWVLVSAFNSRARLFYARQGYMAVGTLNDFVRPGYDEILLRKVLQKTSW